MYRDKRVLVTGCGSLGRHLICQLLEKGSVVTCLDHSEQAFFKFESEHEKLNVKFVLADVTDFDSVQRACRNVDYVVHTVAKKFVNYVEDSPVDAVKTNIYGTVNAINACVDNKVSKLMNISTDKACDPVSLYGMTKLVSERLVSRANKQDTTTIFSSIRHPNYLPSNGSCFSIWQKQRERGEPITITNSHMTRYFIPIAEAAGLTLKALEIAEGGEIFVPATAKEYKITELAKAYKPNTQPFKIVGKRPGERLHESLMTPEERTKAKKTCNNLLWRFTP